MAENTAPENKGVIVTYTAHHELFVNSKDVTERDLEPALTDALDRVDSKVVIFQGDRKVLLGDMIRILEIAKLAGAQQIAIAAKHVAPGQSQRLQTGAGIDRREHDRRLTRTARSEADTNPWR